MSHDFFVLTCILWDMRSTRQKILRFQQMLKDVYDVSNTGLVSKPLLHSFPEYIKAGFVRKVYTIIFLQLSMTFSIMSIFVFNDNAASFAISPSGIVLSYISVATSFASIMILFYCHLHTFPWNAVLLFLITASMTYELSFTASMYHSQGLGSLVVGAMGITMVLFATLTLYVMCTNKNFEFLHGFVFIALCGILLFSVLNLFVQSGILQTGLAYAGTLIFSGFILYDTSQLFHRLGPDDYIEGAIQLYLDVFNLFLSILQVLKIETT